MTSAESSRMSPSGGVILTPYRRDPNTPGHRRARRWAIRLLSLFCFFWGLVWAFLAPSLILILLAPVLILLLAVIWALPDLNTAPTKALERFFFAYLIVAILWPNYISISIPHSGVPWISLTRLTYSPLAIIFLICLAVSEEFRSRLYAALKTERPIFWLVCAFMVIMSYSVLISDRIFFSMDKWADNEIALGFMFFVACYVFTKPGRILRWAAIIWACALVAGLIGVWEWRIRHVPWYGNLPDWLPMDENMIKVMAPAFRGAAYRVRSTFQDALGLGEFMSLAVPFLLCFGFGPFSRRVRYCALATVLFVCGIVVISGARSGMLGVLIDFALYGLFWGIMKWRRDRESIIGPALVIGYPVIGVCALAASLLIGRIRVTLWESGASSQSNLARNAQTAAALPKILTHPWGYGIGRAAETLGYFTPGGLLTIDSYYLSTVLDYGVIGFVVFYGLIWYSAYTSGRHAFFNKDPDPETAFFPAAAISLVAFFAIKSVYSEQVNHPLFFMVIAMIPAMVERVRGDQSSLETGKGQPSPRPAGPRVPMRPAHQPSRP